MPLYSVSRNHFDHPKAIVVVMSDLDIWRAAQLLIQRHGGDSELEAARLQDLMLDWGDTEGRPVWARIRRAIEAPYRRPPWRNHIACPVTRALQ
jgi:hypothetical protein